VKRCPECRRDYTDETLNFCLDDGAPLVDGPASIEEPATAVFGVPPSGSSSSESQTRPQIHRTAEAEPQESPGDPSKRQSLSAHRVAKPLGALVVGILILFGGLFAYWYLSANNKQIESIAVMPFVNDSGNPDVEYLSDGMTETLISSLSQIPQLSVTARSSAFRYKGRETDARKIGSELHVQAIVTGKVVQRASDVSLYVELVDTATDKVIWSETYDRPMTNLVALQLEIARDVSTKLQSKLSGADQQRLAKNYTENAEAYRLYLRGRFHVNRRTVSDFRKAIEYFEQAITLEPNYALAYSGLADAFALLSIYDGGPPHEIMPRAKEAALKALSLDNDLAEAHASLGQILHNYDYDFRGAERAFTRALELNPNYAPAHQWYGELLPSMGKSEEAIAQLRRAMEIDPLSLIINRMLGVVLFHARNYEASIEQLNKAVDLDPNFPGPHSDLSRVYQVTSRHAESVEEFAKWRELNGDTQTATVVRESFAKGGWRGYLQAMTAKARLPQGNLYLVATFHIALGERDRAISELYNAYDRRENDLYWLKTDPLFDPLRDDPRFKELVTKVGYPE
jgi:TolB-like protein